MTRMARNVFRIQENRLPTKNSIRQFCASIEFGTFKLPRVSMYNELTKDVMEGRSHFFFF